MSSHPFHRIVFLFLFLTLILPLSLFSQQGKNAQQLKIDSLTTVLQKNTTSDTLAVINMNELSRLLIRDSQLDLAIEYAQKAKKTSEKLGYKFGEGTAYNIIGIAYVYKGEYPEALENQLAGLEVWKEIDDKWGIANSYNHIGIVCLYKGDYPEALKNYFAGLKIQEEIGNKKGIGNAYNNIGLVYNHQEKYSEALKNFFASLKIWEEIKDKPGIAMSYNSIGNVYLKQKKYSEALESHFASLKIKEELGIKHEIGSSYLNIGVIYKEQGNYSEALKNYFISLKIAEEIGNKSEIAHVYNNIGLVEHELNRPASAKSYFQKSLVLAKEIGQKSLIRDIYYNSTLPDIALGNYKDAYENYKQYIVFRDSLINEENEKESLKASMDYEYEKKEAVIQAELETKNLELKTKNLQRNAAIIGLGFMVLLAILLIYFFRLKNKNLKIEKQNLDLQRREMETIKQTEQFKSRFLANISHEFRTPLTLINGHLEVLKENGRKEDFSHFDEIEQNGKRLLTLINQLLDLSKMESGQYKLQYKKGNVLDEAAMLVQSFYSYAEQHGISLQLHQTANAQQFLADNSFIYSSEALEIIIANLVSNAIKYTPSGGSVNATMDYQNNKLFVTIADTGQGISKEHLQKIFDRFYQVDEPGQRAFAGSGIGLAMVKELSLLHGGDVAVASPDEGGCIFTFWIESQKMENAENTVSVDQNSVFLVKEENQKANNEQQNEEFPLVLVVEDQPELRSFIVQNLGEEYRYAEASNGKDGLALATELLPDLIISDVVMPDTDGFELCETLKRNVATSHIPIVLLTAKADQKDKLLGLETGADDYIVKPFSLAELKLRVKNILNFKQLLRKKFEGNAIPLAEETPELNRRDRKFVDDLIQSIEENLANSAYSVNDLAEVVFLSVSQLTRKLKAITGKTPADFIRNFRLEKAVELLKSGKSVAEAGWEVGFEDAVYFSKVFKKHFGFPPSSVKK